MNTNDARLARLFTAADGGTVEDDTPTATGTTPVNKFDLWLQGEAGNAVGSGGGQYTLNIVAFDVTTGNIEPALLPVAPTFPTTEQFQAGAPNNWNAAGGSSNDFVKLEKYDIDNIPANLKGHVFYYIASLVSANFQIVSIKQSNWFIVV